MKRTYVIPVMLLALTACGHLGTRVCQDQTCQPSPSVQMVGSEAPRY